MAKVDKVKQGKSNRKKGGTFELKVRKNLEEKGWIVSKWSNTVEFTDSGALSDEIYECPVCKERLDNFFMSDQFDNPDRKTSMGEWENRFVSIFRERSGEHKEKCGKYLKLICEGPSCRQIGKLIPAKRKYNPFNKALSIGTGFPDFIAYQNMVNKEQKAIFGCITEVNPLQEDAKIRLAGIIGIEAKSNGYLDKKEKEMCKWLLENKIFSKILIASKGEKRGQIVYKDYDRFK